MPRLSKLRPGHNLVVGHGDTIEDSNGQLYDVDFDAVKGNGRRFQLRARVNSVDREAQTGNDVDIGESRSPALAGK